MNVYFGDTDRKVSQQEGNVSHADRIATIKYDLMEFEVLTKYLHRIAITDVDEIWGLDKIFT